MHAGAVIPYNETGSSRSISIRTIGTDATQLISEDHDLYDPLHFVLLFPHGDTGWRQGIPLNHPTKRQMSPRQFYAQRIMIKSLSQTEPVVLLHHGQRLFQEYCVDMGAKIEAQRLKFVQTHQTQLRADSHKGVSEAISSKDTNPTALGKMVVLPATFHGSARHLHSLYQDSMARVRHFGKPTLFCTMTCSPDWPEFEQLMWGKDTGETAWQRPDVVTRVWELRKKQFLHDVLVAGVLGEVAAYSWVVEFQKRGLPHLHILLIMKHNSRLHTPDDYDTAVCAEIPDPEKFEELHKIVQKHMIHGPCGPLNPKAPCMENGVCTKNFPKDFTPQTRANESSYLEYRRRDNGRTVTLKSGTKLGNEWVVPYNPHLLQKYRCHLNVEVCCSVTGVRHCTFS
jgi:hypothetical protein